MVPSLAHRLESPGGGGLALKSTDGWVLLVAQWFPNCYILESSGEAFKNPNAQTSLRPMIFSLEVAPGISIS